MTKEVLIEKTKNLHLTPENMMELDELFPQALAVFIEAEQASASTLRRKFGISYPKAMSIVDKMEEMGFISAQHGAKGRDVYVTKDEYEFLFGKFPQMKKEQKSCAKHMSFDELFIKALGLFVQPEIIPSASFLRRKFEIGYAKAMAIINKMENLGYISKQEGIEPRRVLISKEEFEKLPR